MARVGKGTVIGLVAVAAIGGGALTFIMQGGLQSFMGEMTYDDAANKLDGLVADVNVSEEIVKSLANVDLGRQADLKRTLPEITEFPLVVDPRASGNDVAVEIFASSEKAGSGTDGWLVEVANAFNSRGEKLDSGKVAKVKVRKIASGTGYQFIASGKYRPQAFTPSNHLWVRMAESHGVEMRPVSEQLVGNVAGIVMKTEVTERVRETYGALDVKSIIDAVVQGNLVMGYTNPFASSTGLNFLVTVLATFSGNEPALMLSPGVTSAFEGFQRGVPFVALTTIQMRDSVERDGSLDGFVMEYQTFIKTPTLQSGYEFIPFGVRHDNPLYGVGDLSEDQLEVLQKFAAFAGQGRFPALAAEYGFDAGIAHEPPFDLPPGDVLVRTQKIWKEKKDAGRPITALFLCDVSGSMRGSRLAGVKTALREGTEFIGEGNSIGLVVFSDRVRVLLPIREFGLNQKASFLSAVEQMDATGKTAMYDGVAVSLKMLVEQKRKNPDAKAILFVLTDGKTNVGMSFDNMSRVVQGLNIPVYTIGYEADIDELSRLSSLVEAASINANEGQIVYKIGTLLNAQM